jgi:hypothetical protein
VGSVSEVLQWLFLAVFWFCIGIGIGLLTNKTIHAMLLWIGAQIIGFVIALPVVVHSFYG